MEFVSDREEWYSYLERDFNDSQFFVSGSDAYGSLQEYMVMDVHNI